MWENGVRPYSIVPKGVLENLEFRRKLIEVCNADSSVASDVIEMCRRDRLFYINSFCWTYDPRKDDQPIIPFITYDFQDNAIDDIGEAIGSHDILAEKSRDMGASWMFLTVLHHEWMFKSMRSFLVVSRNEDYVDKPENPKALFWKLDFLLKKLPTFMVPNFTRVNMNITNKDNGSVIDGESTTADVGRGDRRTAVLMDEFSAFKKDDGYRALSSTRDVTKCRMFNFTPQGTNNAAYDMAQRNISKLRMHWSVHPEKNIGLYHKEGKARSPWYDEQCERAAHPMEIAQELDIDYLGSDFQFFDSQSIDKVQKENCVKEYFQGELSFDSDSLRPMGFTRVAGGRWRLWINHEQLDPMDLFAVSADIATGTGASNSVISIGSMRTSQKIAEFANPMVKPHELAKIAVAAAKFFKNATMIWEANGPGRIFGDGVIDAGYREVYYRTNDKQLGAKESTVPGWYSTRENKLGVLGEYRRALASGDFINRSLEAVQECREYVFLATGSVEHGKSISNIDPSGARANHGDRVIADALLWKMMKQRGSLGTIEKSYVPPNSFAGRRKRFSDSEKNKKLEAARW